MHFVVHNVETLREAAKNLILKVERSCTEEQVKNIKSHLLKFSIDSKHMTPEVHIGVCTNFKASNENFTRVLH